MKVLIILFFMLVFILVNAVILAILTVTPLPIEKEISDEEQIKYLDKLQEKKV